MPLKDIALFVCTSVFFVVESVLLAFYNFLHFIVNSFIRIVQYDDKSPMIKSCYVQCSMFHVETLKHWHKKPSKISVLHHLMYKQIKT